MQRRRRLRPHLTAPRLTVQALPNWPARLLRLFFYALILAAFSGFAYFRGQLAHDEFRGITVQDVFSYKRQVSQLAQENRVLLRRADAFEQNHEIDQQAQAALQAKMDGLEAENASLRSSLGIFEEMLKRPDTLAPLRINHAVVTRSRNGGWRIEAILSQNTRNQVSFSGRYQLGWQTSTGQTGQSPTDPSDSRYALNFRYLTRIEAEIPASAKDGRVTLFVFGKEKNALLTTTLPLQ